MEKDQYSGGKMHAKEVQLDLNTSTTTRKGRALVGRLETDKFLNKGVVISMIKKGWGLDRAMEIHDMPEKNTYLFRFANIDDYNRVLKDEAHRVGSDLGTMHVKSMEDALVVHDGNWDEAMMVRRKPPPTAGPEKDTR
ncbi:hypothetical protein K1719_043084 [Acacia pycnantha]|nr:hypothetical protein K1719_043084 [Acacia pycnantha]